MAISPSEKAIAPRPHGRSGQPNSERRAFNRRGVNGDRELSYKGCGGDSTPPNQS